ncbi:hypothetical protein M0R04_11240 [Candidatus Dojkabacteria bacterium]|jgi:hypothetical protein|nr:hypothetical protein [Candidatus Dojkabacteria bacterium]
MTYNIILRKTGTDTTVTIHTIAVKENWVNTVENFNIPNTPSRYNRGYEKKLLNFQNMARNIEVTGYIALEQDGSTPAETLRTRLVDFFKCQSPANAVCTITTGSSNWYDVNEGGISGGISGVMTGLEFRDIPSDMMDSTTKAPKFFLVTFSIIEGESLLG